jgi:predicted GNAT superfamily acetyltransferase
VSSPELRDLTTLDDFARVVALEKRIWGYTDGDDVTPLPLLAATERRGAILVGAFDGGASRQESGAAGLVGFVYSLPAVHEGRLSQWSHMLGVVPEWRQRGLGRALKLAQRDRAIAMGVDLVEWTFDPLQAVNAHFNFACLGIVAAEYEENVYGASTSLLHGNLPTDRLIAQWWVRDEAVTRRIAGTQPAPLPSGVPSVNALAPGDAWPACGAVNLSLDAAAVQVRIPVGFTEMLGTDPGLAHTWRAATREMFSAYFARGYRAVDFLLGPDATHGSYLMARPRSAAV